MKQIILVFRKRVQIIIYIVHLDVKDPATNI